MDGHHPAANSFANIDLLLRAAGFTLFDIELFRYTRAALPGPFSREHPSNTVGGAVQWADAVYARDLADPDHERKSGYKPTADDVLKLAAFFDIFVQQDCAVELLQARRDLIAPVCDIDVALDEVTRSVWRPPDICTVCCCLRARSGSHDAVAGGAAALPMIIVEVVGSELISSRLDCGWRD